MKFEIKTDSGEYVAKIKTYGFVYSKCIIYKVEAMSFILFKVKILREVWDSISLKSYREWRGDGPSFAFYYAKDLVDDYERGQKKWEEWRDKK